ncbi:MAG: bifunctional phosphoribosylaminoimidazolecarboxamide formyltransferase/IMP cyclohydrolase [Planctomycetales bacterium]|nr:bifunctional phosphoribosylaminoimidazolecarboxamide formyltransferase/IMP cyclohydrolase [Planctomycetales bacterium]
MSNPPAQRALISVSDKTGLAEFAKGLAAAGVEIFSTGGTRKFLIAAGIEARDVARYTGFPEMMEGRVKTLHPKIFGGILCRHDHAEDMASVEEHEIATFEVVVVNLYPFAATIAKPDVSPEEAIENIDIGGPSLVRAAAKNHAFVAIVTSPSQYAEVLAEISRDKATSFPLRQKLAGAAYAHTAEYDTAIAGWFAGREGEGSTDSEKLFPPKIDLTLERQSELRYGENSHQQAAVYKLVGTAGVSLVSAKQLNGKELSYNNLLDLDSALAIVRAFEQPAASVIKHNNPCGAATGASLAIAAKKALAGDPQSAFGGVLAFNHAVDVASAEVLAEPGLFIEAIVAPSFDAAALQILTTKPKWKTNVRLIEVGPLDSPPARINFRQIEGGMLMQEADVLPDPEATEWKVVTEVQPKDALLADLRFGWSIVRHVKSNAIVLAKDGSLVGCGAGQMSRVDSVDIAIAKAGDRAPGSILASDAFFPFPDSIHKAAAAGIVAIIQPGGSVKDAEVIAACNEHGIPMIFTGRRHFKH